MEKKPLKRQIGMPSSTLSVSNLDIGVVVVVLVVANAVDSVELLLLLLLLLLLWLSKWRRLLLMW